MTPWNLQIDKNEPVAALLNGRCNNQLPARRSGCGNCELIRFCKRPILPVGTCIRTLLGRQARLSANHRARRCLQQAWLVDPSRTMGQAGYLPLIEKLVQINRRIGSDSHEPAIAMQGRGAQLGGSGGEVQLQPPFFFAVQLGMDQIRRDGDKC